MSVSESPRPVPLASIAALTMSCCWVKSLTISGLSENNATANRSSGRASMNSPSRRRATCAFGPGCRLPRSAVPRRDQRLVHAAAAVEQHDDLGAAADPFDRLADARQPGKDQHQRGDHHRGQRPAAEIDDARQRVGR